MKHVILELIKLKGSAVQLVHQIIVILQLPLAYHS